MKLKAGYHAGHKALQTSERREDNSTRAMLSKQDALTRTKGVPKGSFAAPLKRQSHEATGGYIKGNPFKR